MSKDHFYFGNIYLVLDSNNGEILAIRDLETGDNLIKNAMCCDPETYVYQPFTFRLTDGVNETEYHPLYSREPLDNPDKKVKITSEQTTEGLLIKVVYPCVSSQIIMARSSTEYVGDSSKEIPIDLFYTVLLCDSGLKFNLHINNTTGLPITEIRFPVIGGVFLGDDYTNNVLVYPRTAGVKNENPIDWFDRQPNVTHWRWNEYRYIYTDGLYRGDPAVHARGMRGYAGVYPGQLSMSWMDLYNCDGGVYYGVHSPSVEPVRLECATYGKKCIGLNLASNFPVKVDDGVQFTTPPTHLIFHRGDWHEGAKIYRRFRYPLIQKCGNIVPSWAKNSVAMTAHYDFKLQDGTYNHTFKDIPQLALDSKSMGVDHMLLTGWHQDGFDNGYPLYYPDSDLGTEKEFIDGIRQAKEMGVHISLYENSSTSFAKRKVKTKKRPAFSASRALKIPHNLSYLFFPLFRQIHAPLFKLLWNVVNSFSVFLIHFTHSGMVIVKGIPGSYQVISFFYTVFSKEFLILFNVFAMDIQRIIFTKKNFIAALVTAISERTQSVIKQ